MSVATRAGAMACTAVHQHGAIAMQSAVHGADDSGKTVAQNAAQRRLELAGGDL